MAGQLSAGMVCANSHTGVTSEIPLDAAIAFLEPELPTETTQGRAGAICQSAADWGAQKTALEQACRMLGNRCKYMKVYSPIK